MRRDPDRHPVERWRLLSLLEVRRLSTHFDCYRLSDRRLPQRRVRQLPRHPLRAGHPAVLSPLSGSRGSALAAVALTLGLGLILSACRRTPDQHLQRAREAIYEKNPQLALREYRLALDEIERDTSAAAQQVRAKALRGAADTYYLELHKIPQAVEFYRELLQACPDSPESIEGHIRLAELLRDYYRDLKGAVSELSAAIARNAPQSAALTYSVSKLYFELSDYAQCVLEADNVANKFATSRFAPDAMFLKAQALAMMEGKQLDAIAAFTALIERFPESELQPHGLFELGKLCAELGQNERAIDVWVEALKRHPDPKIVQSAISRLRRRINETTPARIGDHITAFDRTLDKRSRQVTTAAQIYLEAPEPIPAGTRETSD
jgi:tetratricopeptide (TPR) repeat protein